MTPKRKENSIPYSYNNLSYIFRFIVCQEVAYVRLKAKPEKFKLLPLKSGRGRLREVTNMVISLGNFWYFEKLVAHGRWLQPEVRMYP